MTEPMVELQVAHLHVHSMFSHDGIDNAKRQCEHVKTMGQKYLARTDHGVLGGLVDLERAALATGVVDIKGCEIYYQPVMQRHPLVYKNGSYVEEKKKRAPRYHMTVLCKTQEGYKNLCEMMAHANSSERFSYVPIVAWADLERWHEGLIILSGCISSYLSQALLAGEDDVARVHMQEMQALFGEDFYVEVQPFGGEEQKWVNIRSIELAEQVGVKVVMTSDSHFTKRSDYHEPTRFFQAGYFMRKSTREGDIRVDYSDRFLHSAGSMWCSWQAMMIDTEWAAYGETYLAESVRIAEQCHVTIQHPVQMPYMGKDAAEKLYKKAEAGLLFHLQEAGRAGSVLPERYRRRLEEEMEVVMEKGFVDYMLLVAKVIEYAKMKGILCFARGSAGGFVMCYGLGITLIDPIKYGTSAERFVSRARTDYPDIDLDIASDRREELIAYVERNFPGCVLQIGNYGSWKGFSLASKLAEFYEMASIDGETLRGIHTTFGVSPESFTLDDLLDCPDLADLERQYPGVLPTYHFFYDKLSFISKHAAGVVVAATPISSLVPVVKTARGLVTAYDKDGVEWAGLMKLDMLGVEALAQLDAAWRYAGVSYREDMLDDPAVYRELSFGQTTGIFQFGKRQARDILKQVQPQGLLDIAAVNALNRPVPIQEGSLAIYLSGNASNAALAQYCQATRGALVYQEQVMDFCRNYAGMTSAQVDKVLKMLKKYQEDNLELHTAFVRGCVAKGMLEEEAHQLWQHIRRYLFNFSHAVAYSMIAVLQTWMRLYHPIAWYYSLLKHEEHETKRAIYEADAIKHYVPLLPATVNAEEGYAVVDIDGNGRKAIQRGLLSIKGIGPAVAEAIVSERKRNGDYTSVENFTSRLPARHASSNRVALLQEEKCFAFTDEAWEEAIVALYEQVQKVRPYE